MLWNTSFKAEKKFGIKLTKTTGIINRVEYWGIYYI